MPLLYHILSEFPVGKRRRPLLASRRRMLAHRELNETGFLVVVYVAVSVSRRFPVSDEDRKYNYYYESNASR